jgi:hypothetical protein
MLYSGRRIVAIIEQRWLKRISFSTKGLAHALSENDCNLRVRRGGGLFDRGIQLGWSGLARVLGKRKTMRRRALADCGAEIGFQERCGRGSTKLPALRALPSCALIGRRALEGSSTRSLQ